MCFGVWRRSFDELCGQNIDPRKSAMATVAPVVAEQPGQQIVQGQAAVGQTPTPLMAHQQQMSRIHTELTQVRPQAPHVGSLIEKTRWIAYQLGIAASTPIVDVIGQAETALGLPVGSNALLARAEAVLQVLAGGGAPAPAPDLPLVLEGTVLHSDAASLRASATLQKEQAELPIAAATHAAVGGTLPIAAPMAATELGQLDFVGSLEGGMGPRSRQQLK